MILAGRAPASSDIGRVRPGRLSAVLSAALIMCGCSAGPDTGNAGGAALEQAAIAAGVVRDPDTREIAGLYARDTDQVCIVAAGDGYRIGASVDYGSEGCSAAGTVARDGERLRIAFDGAPGCRFDAEIDGDRIIFPGEVPAACERLCSNRASLAALEADLLSEAASEAAAMRDRRGRELCRS